jgi:hypothetical protein
MVEMSEPNDDLVKIIIQYWKPKDFPYMFFTEHAKKLYEEAVKKLGMINSDLLDRFLKSMEKDEPSEQIRFIFDLRNHVYGDENTFGIVRYIFEKFELKDIKNYDYYLYDEKRLPDSSQKWVEYIHFLDQYNFNPKDPRLCKGKFEAEQRLEILLRNYIDKSKMVDDLENTIKELELQIKFIPGGDGYLESKDNFEQLQNK